VQQDRCDDGGVDRVEAAEEQALPRRRPDDSRDHLEDRAVAGEVRHEGLEVVDAAGEAPERGEQEGNGNLLDHAHGEVLVEVRVKTRAVEPPLPDVTSPVLRLERLPVVGVEPFSGKSPIFG
jgi:hypothetical protein